MKFTVEKMTSEHLADVAEIEKLTFSQPWSEKSLGILLGDAGVAFVAVAEEFPESLSEVQIGKAKDVSDIVSVKSINKKVLAYGGMMTVLDEAQVTNIATHPDFRRLGLADAVLDRMIAYLATAGFKELSLEVRETNLAAIELYRKKGFATAGVRKNFYKNPSENALVMLRTIG